MFNTLFTIISLAIFFVSTSDARPLAARSNTQKYVIAHHIVGNTFPYTVKDWANDIALAHANGIDAFALNVGSDSWQPARVADAYTAASQSNTTFKLFLSFDMTSLPCSSASDANALVNYVTQYSSNPSQFKYPPQSSSTFASTFSGESCTFGQSSPSAGWQSQFKNKLTGDNAVYFVPSFFVDPSKFSSEFGNVMDGALNWNSAWPVSVTTSSLSSLLSSVGSSLSKLLFAGPSSPSKVAVNKLVSSIDSDQQYINALGDKTYMAGVSPWFFTHYSPQTFNKNSIYLSETLYPSRWTALIGARDQVDLAEIITWNDYGESHYIGPIEGAQPNSQAWVNGFNHTAWLDLTGYFATAFKTGSYPVITQDKIYLWARPHPKDATAPDPVGKPTNFDVAQDALYAVVLAAQPSIVALSTSADGSGAQSFSVPAGMTQLQIPLTVGGSMRGSLSRGGQTVVQLAPQGYTFDGSPSTYNYNAFVAMASS